MSVLSDKEIRALAKEGMISPFQDHLVNKENEIPVLSYGLSSYGYDIRLSPNQCLLFGGVQHGMCDAKNFDPEILKETELHEDERGKYLLSLLTAIVLVLLLNTWLYPRRYRGCRG